MANNNFGEVFVNGQLVVFKDEKMARWYFTEVIGSGNQSEPETPATPEPEKDSGINVPDGYRLAGTLKVDMTKYGRDYKKGDPVYGKATKQGNMAYLAVRPSGNAKVAKSAVNITPDTSGSRRQAADSNYTSFSGELVIAGHTLKVRLAEGKLHRSGKEATNLHFADNLKPLEDVRDALKAAHFRFSGYLTNQTEDSNSTWYIPSIFDISQVQDMFD